MRTSTRAGSTAANAGPLTLLQAAEVAQWYEELSPHVRRWLEGKGAVSAREADDVIAETFVRVIEHMAHIASLTPAHRRGYVFAIAGNITRNNVRYQHSRRGAAMGMYFSQVTDVGALEVTAPHTAAADWLAHAQPDANPEQVTAARESLRHVWERLHPTQRELLALVAQGYSLSEMAAHYGSSEHYISTRIWRMRRALLDVGKEIAR